MTISYIYYKLKYLLSAHVLNPFWHSKDKRRKIRGIATGNIVSQYLDSYRDFMVSVDVSNENGSLLQSKERIFSIWFQGEDNAPEIVKACYRSIRHNCTQELVVLDSSNIRDWITLPEHRVRKWEKGKLAPAHFADLCRMELLYRYGGIWMDATCFATAPVPEWIEQQDFFIYLYDKDLIWNSPFSYSFVNNCFFRARKGDPLLKVWRDTSFEYWRREDSRFDYFIHQLIFKKVTECNDIAAEEFAKMPHVDQGGTHALWFRHKDEPFDKEKFQELISGAFFQKTEYKSNSSKNPVKGSFAETLIRMYR